MTYIYITKPGTKLSWDTNRLVAKRAAEELGSWPSPMTTPQFAVRFASLERLLEKGPCDMRDCDASTSVSCWAFASLEKGPCDMRDCDSTRKLLPKV